VQATGRKYIFKLKFASWKATLVAVRSAMTNRLESELTPAMDLMNELPNAGRHLALYKEANTLLVMRR